MKSLAFSLGVLFLLAGCATAQPDSAIYSNAIADALQPTAAKIDKNLWAISSDNEKLEWMKVKGVPYVKVVSYIAGSDSTYYPRDQWDSFLMTAYEMWVTPAPQMQQTCQTAGFGKKEGLPLRLNQLLGLKPNDVKGFFMELYVRPSDMFRPCADPEVDDCECGLILPANSSQAHIDWYNNIRATQYYTPKFQIGYPWTQLGYTYDWNPDNKTHVGLSEYVLRPGAHVVIKNIVPAAEFCKQP